MRNSVRTGKMSRDLHLKHLGVADLGPWTEGGGVFGGVGRASCDEDSCEDGFDEGVSLEEGSGEAGFAEAVFGGERSSGEDSAAVGGEGSMITVMNS